MINALHTLMKKYQNKKVYIWDINRDSLITFKRAAFKGILIYGFITLEEEYEGQEYINRPVVSVKQILDDENVVIIASDKVKLGPVSKLDDFPRDRIVYWSEALEFNDCIYNEKIIVYGVGSGAEQLSEILAEQNIEIQFYCVSEKKDVAWYKGKKILEINELAQYSDYAILISVHNIKFQQEIMETLADFQGQIYLDWRCFENGSEASNLIQDIDYAIKAKRDIYLYGNRNVKANYVEQVLGNYGIKIVGYVNETANLKEEIRSIYDVAYDGVEDKLIVIIEDDSEKIIRIRENVELAGFSLESGNYVGYSDKYTLSRECLTNWKQCHDPLLGASVLYDKENTAWKLYGKKNRGFRIVVLGDSTSSEKYHPENWVRKLYYKFCTRNIPVNIYNGAFPGDDIVDEVLRLLRDGHILQPQIVISMSGVNNLVRCHDCENQFNEKRIIKWIKTLAPNEDYCSGLRSIESEYSFWNRNMQLLKVLSEFYGAQFFGFLQPINYTIVHKTLREKSLYEQEESILGSEDFVEHLSSDKDDSNYINLLNLFEHQNDMFHDICHYTDRANEIIADNVYDVIFPIIGKLSM